MQPHPPGSTAGSIAILAMVLMASAGPAVAQGQSCDQLSGELLAQLDRVPPPSLEAEAEQRRRILLSRECDPQTTGYNLGVESIRLNNDLDVRPAEKKPIFRPDRLIQINY
jgi:hypothetical protein